MNGYLAPVSRPHIYKHVPEQYHELLAELVKPQSTTEAAKAAGYSYHYITNNLSLRLCEYIKVDKHYSGWRIAIIRAYYGIDRCWCQAMPVLVA